MKTIKRYWEEKPLLLILIVGGLFRLISVIFSRGWGMHDDHFLVIETAQSWVNGQDYNNWLPMAGNTEPPGHSYFYPGLHYLLFLFLKLIHINDPQAKMYIVRFLHALYSMPVIWLGFKITERLSDKKNAAFVGLLLAIYWFMPFLSVRNLAEMVCIPVLMFGVYMITDYQIIRLSDKKTSSDISEKSEKSFNLLLAGLMFGLAFSIRYQTFVFVGGILLVLLFQRRLRGIIYILTGFFLTMIIIEGGIDYFIWGYPFAEFKQYIHYNINNAYSYVTQSWYTYILFLSGFLIPPVSIFLFIGFFKVWKKHLLIFLPTLFFFIFHSYFPNKQERFIISIIPFIIILGVIGWNEILSSKSKVQSSKFVKGSWIFFWIINLIALPVVSTVYTKRARAESMIYLSKYQNVNYFLQEGTSNIPPTYYLGYPAHFVNISGEELSKGDTEQLRKEIIIGANKSPEFVLFYDDKDLANRVSKIKEILPGLEHETTIQPGFIDKVVYYMNPKNNINQTIFIYRVTEEQRN